MTENQNTPPQTNENAFRAGFDLARAVSYADWREAYSQWSGSPAPQEHVATPADNRHDFIPNKKFPWFCAHCGYAPHEPLKHFQPSAAKDGSAE